MTAAAEELKTKLASLTQREQAELAYYLIRRLDETGYVDDYSEEWTAELDRRRDDVVSGQDAGEDADVVFARARARLK